MTAIELIAELRSAAAGTRFAALVVTFDDSSELVPSTEPKALEQIEQLLARGGRPVGFLAHIHKGTRNYLASKPLPVYADDPQIKALLHGIIERGADGMERTFGIEIKRLHNPEKL